MSARRSRSRGRDPANARARDTTVSAPLWSYLEMGGVRGANPRPADNTVPKLAAQRRLHARHALVRHPLPATRNEEGRERRLTRGGIECPGAHMRRTSKRISSAQSGYGRARVSARWANGVRRCRARTPLHHGASDGEEGETDPSLPILGALDDQVVQGVTAARREIAVVSRRAQADGAWTLERGRGAHLGILPSVGLRWSQGWASDPSAASCGRARASGPRLTSGKW